MIAERVCATRSSCSSGGAKEQEATVAASPTETPTRLTSIALLEVPLGLETERVGTQDGDDVRGALRSELFLGADVDLHEPRPGRADVALDLGEKLGGQLPGAG